MISLNCFTTYAHHFHPMPNFYTTFIINSSFLAFKRLNKFFRYSFSRYGFRGCLEAVFKNRLWYCTKNHSPFNIRCRYFSLIHSTPTEIKADWAKNCFSKVGSQASWTPWSLENTAQAKKYYSELFLGKYLKFDWPTRKSFVRAHESLWL